MDKDVVMNMDGLRTEMEVKVGEGVVSYGNLVTCICDRTSQKKCQSN